MKETLSPSQIKIFVGDLLSFPEEAADDPPRHPPLDDQLLLVTRVRTYGGGGGMNGGRKIDIHACRSDGREINYPAEYASNHIHRMVFVAR